MANGPEFFQTIMGRAFYEGTMPRLVKQLEKLNENMEKLAEAKPAPQAQPPYLLLDESLDYFKGSEDPGLFNRCLLDRLPTEALRAELEERGATEVVEVHAGQKVILKGAKFLGDKLDPKELANTSESMKPVQFHMADNESPGDAFLRAQAHIEQIVKQAEAHNAREWVVLCKRTHDPKLSWLERTLSAHGILNRRNGSSFHAPILEVPADLENKAQLILSLVDDMDDDEDPFYVGER